jgi:hypothetical protein
MASMSSMRLSQSTTKRLDEDTHRTVRTTIQRRGRAPVAGSWWMPGTDIR